MSDLDILPKAIEEIERRCESSSQIQYAYILKCARPHWFYNNLQVRRKMSL